MMDAAHYESPVVVDSKQYGKALYVEVRHRHASDPGYVLHAVLVFEGTTLAKLKKQNGGRVPIFGIPGSKFPFAQFEPTEKGRNAARSLCSSLSGRDPKDDTILLLRMELDGLRSAFVEPVSRLYNRSYGDLMGEDS